MLNLILLQNSFEDLQNANIPQVDFLQEGKLTFIVYLLFYINLLKVHIII